MPRVPSSSSSSSSASLLLRTATRRPYEVDREESSFRVAPELLDRVALLPPVRAVMQVLKARAHKKPKLEVDQPDEQKEDKNEVDDDEPEVSSTKPVPAAPVLPSPAPSSAVLADQIAATNRMADIVVKVCNAPTLAQKRDLILNYCANDPDCDVFCNVLLEEMGARKDGETQNKCLLFVLTEQGMFVLDLSKKKG